MFATVSPRWVVMQKGGINKLPRSGWIISPNQAKFGVASRGTGAEF